MQRENGGAEATAVQTPRECRAPSEGAKRVDCRFIGAWLPALNWHGKNQFEIPRRGFMILPMPPGQLQIRRATVDDLPALRALWLAAKLPADELEGRLTEFQVVESGGQFAGALGLEVLRQHARLHSEDYADFAVADAARELFWERVQTVAANHGVFRIWTQETSPFWTHWGFQPATVEMLARRPDEWKNLAGRWLTLELKNEDAIKDALQNQFAGFMDAEKKQTERVVNQARKLRLFITIGGFAVFLICLAVAFYLFLHRPAPWR
jgi:N-acetylglutamate synthase-like GNAT family acetyltransferase